MFDRGLKHMIHPSFLLSPLLLVEGMKEVLCFHSSTIFLPLSFLFLFVLYLYIASLLWVSCGSHWCSSYLIFFFSYSVCYAIFSYIYMNGRPPHIFPLPCLYWLLSWQNKTNIFLVAYISSKMFSWEPSLRFFNCFS